MKNKAHIMAITLIAAGFSLTSAVNAETPSKTQTNTTKPAPTQMPAGGMGDMTNCSPADMKDGQCPQGGMTSDHMKQMHEHMQKMHPQTATPATGTSSAVKPDAAGKPAGAEDHAAHHPAQ